MKKLRLFLANVGRRHSLYPLATPPMGILYLASYLRSRFDLEIQVVNQRAENYTYEELADMIVRFEPDVVGLGTLTPFGYALAPVTKAVRAACPNALILLGGPHVSAFGAKVMEGTTADAAVSGEGELAFEMILRAWMEGGGFDEIPGLIWRDKTGEIITNPGSTPIVPDLDALPMPAYDLIDLPKYWKLQSMPPVPRRRYASLVSSRGCPYHCMWCHRVFGKRYRAHSAERIVEEVEYHVKKYGVDDFEFLDDIFNLDEKRVVQFSELAHKRGLKFKIAFPNAVRGDRMSRDAVDALVDAGMYFCSFALESGSPRLQEFTGKKLDIEKFLKGIEMTVRRGVFANGFMMLGFPTETEEEMRLTIDTATNSMLHTASFFTVTPFPNTELYSYVQQHNPEKLEGLSYNDTDFSRIPVNLSLVPDEVLFRYQRMANRRFFTKPSRIYRIIRDFPQPHLLPLYVPIYLNRVAKGLFRHTPE